MKKLLVALCLLFSTLNATITRIDQGFYVDTTLHTTFEESLDLPLQHVTSTNFGYGTFAVWSRTTLHNPTTQQQKIVLYNPRPGVDYINVYGFRGKTPLFQHQLGDMNPPSQRLIFSRFSAFEVSLEPHESLTLMIRHRNLHGVVDTQWIMLDKQQFTMLNFYDTLIWGILIGTFIILLVYNSAIAIAIRRQEFFYYNLIGLFTLLGQVTLGGILYLADWGIPLDWLSRPEIFFVTALGFIIAFNSSFFGTSRYRLFRIGHTIAYTLLLVTFCLYLIFQYDFHGLVIKAMLFGNWGIIMAYLLIIGLFFAYKRMTGSWYYVVGLLLLFISSFFPLLSLFTKHETISLSVYAFPLGMILDFIFVAFALNARLREEKILTEKKERVMCFLSRFDSNGTVMNNIIHQWKLPISRLGSLFTELETYLFLGRPVHDKLKEQMPQITYNLALMRDTVKEFYGFYQTDIQRTSFHPVQELKAIVALLDDSIQNTHCQIDFAIDETFIITTYKHAFAHIFLVLFHNALDVAVKREIPSPHLILTLRYDDAYLYFDLCDNCGGIFLEPIEKVFDLFETQNDTQTPRGTGLAIAKMLAYERLEGSLQVKNIEKGCCFTLTLKDYTQRTLL